MTRAPPTSSSTKKSTWSLDGQTTSQLRQYISRVQSAWIYVRAHYDECFSETFDARPLSEWPHHPPIFEMCGAFVGKVEIVGWRDPGREQGTTHKNMSMEEFMDAHVTTSQLETTRLSPHFSSPSLSHKGQIWSSSFELTVQGWYLYLFSSSRIKSHQAFQRGIGKDALSTVSAPKIESHAKDFRKYCPDNIYISMIVAYPTKWTSKLPALPDATLDASGLWQVVINVGDNNFGDIFPKDHVEFIDRLKDVGKRSAGDDDNDGEDRFKKQRGKWTTG
ncbi:MAG: hypothetical protein BYD32DRAFT_438885 [Podila humilis]|nr:MAG: hypothetical protein BYD32DRAFT_438885 [Podila humilis]